jgi:hypothetical protein
MGRPVRALAVGSQNTIREQNGVRSGMKQGGGRRERGLGRGPRRENGRRLRPAGRRSPSADAADGAVQMNIGPETAYAAWRQA